MARPSRRGDKTSAAKTRKAGSAKSRAGATTNRAARLKRSTAEMELKEAREQQAATMRQPGDKVRPGKGQRQKTTGTKSASVRTSMGSSDTVDRRHIELARELEEALQQQTATSEVLSIIRKSPADAQPVFEAIVQSAARLCDALFSIVYLKHNDRLHVAATKNFSALATNQINERQELRQINRSYAGGRAVLDRTIVHLYDVLEDPEYSREFALAGGWRAVLAVPLLHEGKSVGVVSVGKAEPKAFSERQVQLLQTFADQAVIAIENVRLFEEVQAKTHDLEEALRYQTGSANILNVIASSPTDVQPVLQAIVESACELCGASDAMVRLNEDGGLALSAHHGPFQVSMERLPIDRNSTAGLAVLDQKPVHVHDLSSSEGDRFPEAQERARRFGVRTALSVPLLREGESIGAIMIRRQEVNPFQDKQIALLQTFADQAVIAIENARLFNATQQSLERQTATAEILKVIASSPSDVQPVFDAIAESARRVVDGFSALVTRVVGEEIHLAAFTTGSDAGEMALTQMYPQPLSSSLAAAQVVRTGQIVMHVDTESDAGVTKGLARARGFRSLLSVPMLREGNVIGTINVTRLEPGGFDENAIELMKTFADQAVIAIENARLFNETQEALERQTATADILKVIASSPDDVQPVFQAIAERSSRIVEGFSTAVFSFVDDVVYLSAFTPTYPEADAFLQARFPARLSEFGWGTAIQEGEVLQIPDTEEDASVREVARLRGYRSMLFVSLLREGAPIGMISVTRVEPGPFADRHVQLLTTFADQAVIAISNVGLFNEVQERTGELSRSLDDLRAAQDRLVQTEKLASLGQLTAGIAHEIKNPLNFVNNFSHLSAELVDEMMGVFENPALDEASRRKELDEIRDLLKSNLEKVVQHGKRADSIVKNMLLHSREGSGERRSTDINALVGESLNLAYHGARAEKSGFAITLKHDLDPDAGTLELYPQEITRALLNLISNGFYAATKRKAENGDGAFEPTLRAVTRNLGEAVEIRIRDNGIGIPPKVREKMFNPFFTTKPTGEGTGLGLSMTHDIIVKQHGGKIDVETEPGAFTEFIITLPRGNGSAVRSKPE